MNSISKSLRQLWPLIRPYKSKLFFIFGCGLIISLCNVAQTALVKLLFGEVFEMKRTSLEFFGVQIGVWLVPLMFPVLYLIWGAARYLHYLVLIMVNERIIADLRTRAVDQAVRLNLSFHSQFESGSGGLMSRILNDTQVLQVGLSFFGDVLREPLIALFLLIYMLYLDWKLTFALLAFLPVFVFLTRQIGKSLRKYGHVNRQALEEVTAQIKENLDGIRVIQSFGLEDKMGSRLKASMEHYIETRRKIVSREEAVSPINEFLASNLVMGLVLYMMSLILNSKASASEFLAFLFAAGQLQNPIKRLQESLVRVQQTVVVTDRLFSLIHSEDRVSEPKHPAPWPKDFKKIEFKNIRFRYKSNQEVPREVLKGLNFTVQRGEVIALVGSSGSGKSTLVNLLERFYDPTEGQITIDETPLQNFSLSELRSKIALVTQDVFLFRDSIAANIESGSGQWSVSLTPERKSKIEEAARHAHASDFVSQLKGGLAAGVGERGGMLSGGEKQRISIARAFFKDAPILILDEATSALDSVSEQEVQKGIQELMQGRTVFVIAHRLSTVREADRILVMKDGMIVESGQHEELLKKNGEYAKFHQIQFKLDQ